MCSQFYFAIRARQHLIALRINYALSTVHTTHQFVTIVQIQVVAVPVVCHHHNHFGSFRICRHNVCRFRPTDQNPHVEYAPCLPYICLSRHTPIEHGLPVTIVRRKTKQAVKPHIIQYQTILFALIHTHAAPHLLQILCQRKCWARQLYELHIWAVKSLAKQVNIHKHIYLSLLKAFNRSVAFISRCSGTDGQRFYAMSTIVIGHMIGMVYVYGINNALLAMRILLHSMAKPLYTGTHIKLFAHFPQREIAVCGTFFQSTHHLLLLAIGPYGHVVV